MSMLERAAPTFEQHAVPPLLTSRRSHARSSQRKLGAGFWHHGAAALELADAWQILGKGVPPLAPRGSIGYSPAKTTTLTASAFHLDFLYPDRAVSFLRKLAPSALERHNASSLKRRVSIARHFAITAQRFKKKNEKDIGAEADADFLKALIAGNAYSGQNKTVSSARRSKKDEDLGTQTDAGFPEAMDADPKPSRRRKSVASARARRYGRALATNDAHDASLTANADVRPDATAGQTVHTIPAEGSHPLPSASKDIVRPTRRRNSHPPFADMQAHDLVQFVSQNPISRLSKSLEIYDRIGQEKFSMEERRQFIRYLVNSGVKEGFQAALRIFSSLDRAEWTGNVVASAIRANLQLGRGTEANLLMKDTLSIPGVVQRLDTFLALYTRTRQWDMLLDIWQVYLESPERRHLSIGCFRKLESVSFVVPMLARLYRNGHRDYDLPEPQKNKAGLEALVKQFSTRLTNRLTPGLASFILTMKKQPELFEDYIMECAATRRAEHAVWVYRVYRKRSDVEMSLQLLKTMVEIFSPHDAEGMELVMRDWYKRYTFLNVYGYVQFLKFYANRGDVESTQRLWAEYVERYPENLTSASRGRDTFSFLLQVHAVRGELEEVQRAFKDISEKYQQTPNVACWSILLSAHVRLHDLEGAIQTFERLCRAVKPNAYSYATLMSLVGPTGDLDYILQLSEDAMSRGIAPNVEMMKGTVAALCANDRAIDAEAFCLEATERHAGDRAECTVLWDRLLRYYSRSRDLTTINRLLGVMEEHDIPLGPVSYEQILWALSLTRQVAHAQRLLNLGLEQRVFRVRPQHFIPVMCGYLLVSQSDNVLKVDEVMESLRMPRSGTRTALVLSALAWKKEPKSDEETRRSHDKELLAELLRVFRGVFDGQDSPSAASSDGLREMVNPLETEQTAELFARMVEILTTRRGLKELADPRELLKQYEEAFPERAGFENIPLRLLSASISLDFENGDFAQAKETFGVLLERAAQERESRSARQKEEPVVLPVNESILSDATYTMQRICMAEKDSTNLRGVMQLVSSYGFRLDNRNWNFCVLNLARLDDWQGAFSTFETRLLPGWQGFRTFTLPTGLPLVLPAGLEKTAVSPRTLRPRMHTVYVLARAYRSMIDSAPWSHLYTRALTTIEEDCPTAVLVIKEWWKAVSLPWMKDKEAAEGPEGAEEGASQKTRPSAGGTRAEILEVDGRYIGLVDERPDMRKEAKEAEREDDDLVTFPARMAGRTPRREFPKFGRPRPVFQARPVQASTNGEAEADAVADGDAVADAEGDAKGHAEGHASSSGPDRTS